MLHAWSCIWSQCRIYQVVGPQVNVKVAMQKGSKKSLFSWKNLITSKPYLYHELCRSCERQTKLLGGLDAFSKAMYSQEAPLVSSSKFDQILCIFKKQFNVILFQLIHSFPTIVKSNIWNIESLYKPSSKIVSAYCCFLKNWDIQKQQSQSFKTMLVLPQRILTQVRLFSPEG